MGKDKSYPYTFFDLIEGLSRHHIALLAALKNHVRPVHGGPYRIDCQRDSIRNKFGDGHNYRLFAVQPEAGQASSRNPKEIRNHAEKGGKNVSCVATSEKYLEQVAQEASTGETSLQQILKDTFKHEDVRVPAPGDKQFEKNMGLIDHAGRQYARIIHSGGEDVDKPGVFINFEWLGQVEKEAKGCRREDTEKWKTMKKNVQDKRKAFKQGELLVTATGKVVTAPPE